MLQDPEDIPLPAGFRRLEWPGGQPTRAGSKRVFFAFDNLLQRNVVVAALRAPLGSEQRAAALTEAQRLAQLCDHPNISTIFGAVLSGDWLLLINQYAAGGDLRRLLNAGALPLPRALRLAQQLANALRHAHHHQLIHRDLKPENILLNESLDVRLADFGIAARADEAVHQGETVGTPGYMAPEQIRGTGSVAGDLYSFGCILFELLTQRPVFIANNGYELLRRHLNDAPPDPQQLNSRIPAPLAELCLALLAKTPQDRPQSAQVVLEAMMQLNREVAPHQAQGTRRTSVPQAGMPQFIGRRAELTQLHNRLEQLTQHSVGGVVLLEAAPGMGKSYLVEALEPHARAMGATLLLGRALEDVRLPFQVFLEALRPLSGALDSASAGGHLQRWLAGTRPATSDEQIGAHSRDTLLIELDRALRDIALRQPLVIVIDDLHWTDEASLALFQQLGVSLASAVASLPVLLIGTLRPVLVESPGQAGVQRLLRRLRRYRNVLQISLPPFGVQDVTQLVEEATSAPCSRELAERVLNLSLGNPLHARELAAHLWQRDLLDRRGGFLVPSSRLDEMALPMSLAGIVAERLHDLSDTTRRVLSVAACHRGNWRLEGLSEVLREDQRVTLRAMDEAQATGYVASQSGQYTFVHPMVRHAFYGRLSEATRAIWHFELAQQIARQQPAHWQLAHARHLSLAGSVVAVDERVAALEVAAGMALEQFAWEQAGSFAETALSIDTGADAARVARLHRVAGNALHFNGEARAAIVHWHAAAEFFRTEQDWVLLTEVLSGIARAATNFGLMAAARTNSLIEELCDCAARAAARDPIIAAEGFSSAAAVMTNEGAFDKAQELSMRGLALLGEGRRDQIMRSRIGVTRFVQSLQRSQARDALAHVQNSAAIGGAIKHQPTYATAMQRIPVPLVLLGELREAERVIPAAISCSNIIAGTGQHGITYGAATALAILRGEFNQAVDAGEAAFELLCTTSYVQAASYSLPALAAAYAHQARFDDARRVLRLLSDASDVLQTPLAMTALQREHEVLVNALQFGGAGATAVTRPVPQRGIEFTRLSRYGVAIESVSLGATCTGIAHCMDACEFALRNEIAFTVGWTGYVPRWLAIARWRSSGDSSEAVLLLEACRRQCEIVGATFETARCTLELAAAQFAAGRRALANATVDAAVMLFNAMGAHAWVRVAERMLNQKENDQ